MGQRIGIYSGTFDPIHPGHIAFAREALRVCKLDEIVFLPEPNPRGKHAVTDISHRVALIERAINDVAGLRVVRLAAQQFTIRDTLPELRAAFGGADLTFLFGSDVVRTFSFRWADLDVLLREASFAIGMRAGDRVDEITAIMDGLQREYAVLIRYKRINTADADMASSQIRSGAGDLSRLHPATVAYMQEHGLYAG